MWPVHAFSSYSPFPASSACLNQSLIPCPSLSPLTCRLLAESTGKGSKVKAGGPLSPRGSGLEKATGSGEAHRRAKRCTCFTYKDKECVYYCHLDIIWINTPERTVPYGLANYRGGFRGRRSTGQHRKSVHSSERAPSRCACTDRCDEPCMRFCTMTQSGQSHSGGGNPTDSTGLALWTLVCFDATMSSSL
uniref:Endothelin-3 n=1 Tax=Varanus komodoensis TaxID=61221 RepID=A0A8D2J1H9_VARKO